MLAKATTREPSYDVDLYSDDAILDPHPHYKRIRDLGPAVWLPKSGLWAIGRHADVKAALAAHNVLISGKGVAATERLNRLANNNILATDEPRHGELRKVIATPVMPRGLADIRPQIEQSAHSLIEDLLRREEFDAMTDLAQFLPLTIVSELLGLPESGRQNMLRWGAATFDAFGGQNHRYDAALPIVMELREFCDRGATRDVVRPGSWVAGLYDAADAGLIDAALIPQFTRDYIAPSLDTTIFATGHLLFGLGRHPDQWQAVRDTPTLIGNAINEAIRYESPIRGFTRFAAADYSVDGTVIPKSDRALILYASANRDERRWPDADRFDVTRNLSDHVGFGHGVHQCMGMQLARLEMKSLMTAMVRRVARIEVGDPVFEMNNMLRGFASLPMRFVAG